MTPAAEKVRRVAEAYANVTGVRVPPPQPRLAQRPVAILICEATKPLLARIFPGITVGMLKAWALKGAPITVIGTGGGARYILNVDPFASWLVGQAVASTPESTSSQQKESSNVHHPRFAAGQPSRSGARGRRRV